MTLARARRDTELVESAYADQREAVMNAAIALAIGLLSGAHTSTWGMYKDSPHEGFTWLKYFRSIVLSAGDRARRGRRSLDFDLARAWARVVLFGLTYVTERGLVELYKTFLREEDQSKYFIPMQFHVMGRVVESRRVRWAVAAAWVTAVLLVAWGLHALPARGLGPAPAGWRSCSSAASAAGSRPSAARSRTRPSRASRRSSSSAARWSRCSWARGGRLLQPRLPAHRAVRARLHGGDHRDLQDLLLPEQAARQVRGQAHPVPALRSPGATASRRSTPPSGWPCSRTWPSPSRSRARACSEPTRDRKGLPP